MSTQGEQLKEAVDQARAKEKAEGVKRCRYCDNIIFNQKYAHLNFCSKTCAHEHLGESEEELRGGCHVKF